MSFFSKKIEEPKRTQIIAKNLKLDELIKDNILKELKEKFSEDGEITVTFIRFHLLPKTEPMEKIEIKKGEKGEIVFSSSKPNFMFG